MREVPGRRIPALAGLLALALFAGFARGGPDSPLAAARAIQEKVLAAVERVRPAVVSLSVMAPPEEEGDPPRRGVGSGVVVDRLGHVLTCYHVAGWATEITVIFAGSRRVKARILGRDPGGDLVLLELMEPGPWPSVEIFAEGEVEPGCWVLAMGNPRGEANDGRATVTLGTVTAIHCLGGGIDKETLFYGDAIQTDAEINPGNSGGPLFDLEGRLVGINGRIATRIRTPEGAVNANVGFAVPASQIRRFLPYLKAGRKVAHGFLGVRLESQAGGRPRVAFVIPGTAANKAGVKVGDTLLAIDGEEISTHARLTNLVFSRPAGTRIGLTLLRDARERVLFLELGSRPEDDS